MSDFILDCSVTMAWAFEDEADRYALSVLAAFRSAEAVVPPLWVQEVANVILVAERRKRLSPEDTDMFLETLSMLPIRVESADMSPRSARLVALGRSSGLSAYDACYLDLARRLNLPIATKDDALRNAARRINVRLFRP